MLILVSVIVLIAALATIYKMAESIGRDIPHWGDE